MDVDHRETGDRDAAEQDRLQRWKRAEPLDPACEMLGHPVPVDRKAADGDRLDEIRTFHHHGDERHRISLTLLEGAVVDAEHVRTRGAHSRRVYAIG